MTSAAMFQLAENKAKEALTLDQQGKRSAAMSKYIEAADILVRVLKVSKNPQLRRIALERADQYVARAKTLRSGRLPAGGPAPDFEGVELEDQEDKELQDDIDSMIIKEKPDVKWEDVADLEEAKQALRESVILPMLRPDLFTGARRPWKGVLLFGPPGCGKTLIAKAVANEAGCTFFNADAASIVSKWLGESERLVKNLFGSARKEQPAIVFMDEVDALTGERGSDQVGGERRLKTQFLIEMDGMKSRKGDHIVVLGATNRPWDLDAAFRRRFERRIMVPMPEFEARVRIFEIHTRGIDLAPDVDFNLLGEKTVGYAGSDIALICREATLQPIRELDASGAIRDKEVQARSVQLSDFMESVRNIRSVVSPEELARYLEWDSKHGS
ncbi:MAG: AAA family ATPase [Candidatus Odinarchaeota archaeon]